MKISMKVGDDHFEAEGDDLQVELRYMDWRAMLEVTRPQIAYREPVGYLTHRAADGSERDPHVLAGR